MKSQRDKLHQYQRRITVLTDKETDIAKQMLARGDKKRALLALRRKKYQETLLSKTDAQLEQLEKLTSNVEFALIQKDVVFGLQQGTKVLEAIHAEMGGLEHVEKLMGETAEAIAYQQVRFYQSAWTQLRSPSLLLRGIANFYVAKNSKSATCWVGKYQLVMRRMLRRSWRLYRLGCLSRDTNSRRFPTRTYPSVKEREQSI